jgi:hypothetical protein
MTVYNVTILINADGFLHFHGLQLKSELNSHV